MIRSYINPIGQKVVDVDCGYKVYDAEMKDDVILRVGDDYKGSYVYIDRDPVINNTDDVCFMDNGVLMSYETSLKIICSTRGFTDEQILKKIISINKGCGLKGTDVVSVARETGKDPVECFEEFLEKYFEKKFEK